MGHWYIRSQDSTKEPQNSGVPGASRLIGPYSEIELRRLSDSGALSGSTKVFQIGREHESVPLTKVIKGIAAQAVPPVEKHEPRTSDVTFEPPSTTTLSNELEKDLRPSPPSPEVAPTTSRIPPAKLPRFWKTFWSLHPKRRYFARMVDLGIGALLVNQGLTSIVGYHQNQLAKVTWVLLLGVFVTGLINSFSVSRFGTTFGKWMFSIRVYSEDRSNLSLPRALQREGLVFLFGFSGGVVFTLFLSLIISGMFIYLKRNTPWDYLTRTSTEIGAISFLRIIFGAALIVVAHSAARLL